MRHSEDKMILTFLSLLTGSCFSTVLCSNEIPRLKLRQDSLQKTLKYDRNLSQTVLFQDDSENLFIGGINYVLQVDINDGHVVENFTLTAKRDQGCEKSSCENAVTVIEKLQNNIFVCGTNEEHPRCWKLHLREGNRSSEVVEYMDGTGISPHRLSQNSMCLTADGDLYAAAPLYKEGTSLQFRRKAGRHGSVWMYDPWITEPTFISAFLARRAEDQMNEKIYVFFREKNSDNNPEADPWISRVARVCKVDRGGSKRLFQNIWTTFLKARLVCAIPGESLFFNRLQDIFVLHSEDWRHSRVYALFSSSWNSTAVCIYTLAELDAVFESSIFKGYNGEIPSPRPGTCVEDSRSLPTATISVIQKHPEMNDWVHPIQKDSPFYISNNNYTRIAVDRVQAADDKMYNVLLLATDTGVIHKMLEDGSKPFIISETSLCYSSAPVQSMKLNSQKRKLFVGYPGQLSVLDLQRCHDYNSSCEDCVLARDPYCAWTENGCTSQIKGGIQNIATGETHVCNKNSEKLGRTKRDVSSSSQVPVEIEHTISEGFPYYLSCPIESHHATYTWVHGNIRNPCQQMQSDCLHLIPAITVDDYGVYMCESSERDYTKVVKKYKLRGRPETARASSSAFKMVVREKWLWILCSAVLFTVYHPA